MQGAVQSCITCRVRYTGSYSDTWPLHSLCTTLHTLLCTSAHLCAPSDTPVHLCTSPFLGLSPLSDFPLTSYPLLATMCNPTLLQPASAVTLSSPANRQGQ